MNNKFRVTINLKFDNQADAVNSAQEKLSRLATEIAQAASVMNEKGDSEMQFANGNVVITNGIWAGDCETHGPIWVDDNTIFLAECPECGTELTPF